MKKGILFIIFISILFNSCSRYEHNLLINTEKSIVKAFKN